MLKTLTNQRGVALITALMLTLISLAIILSLLYLVSKGGKLSASQKRYHNSLEASYAGIEFFSKDLLPRLIGPAIENSLNSTTLTNVNGLFGNVSLQVLGTATPAAGDITCLRQKLTSNTASWTSCTAERRDSSPTVSPDLTFVLNGTTSASNFMVYAKIVDTQEGNTSTGSEGGEEGLLTAGVVSSGVGGEGVLAPTTHYPYYYTLEVQGEKAVSPEERAQLSVLYAY